MSRSIARMAPDPVDPSVDGLVEVEDDLLGALEGIGHGGHGTRQRT